MPTEADIRPIVRQVVDELLAAGPSTASPAVADSPDDALPPPRADIAIGADHGGVELKALLIAQLRERGYSLHDCGTQGTEPADYPVIARAVARLVAAGACRWGIVIDGAGIGSCMAANKVPGIRAAMCYDISSARNSREHNHANVLSLGAGLIGPALARQIVDAWLATEWGGGRHARRVALIEDSSTVPAGAARSGEDRESSG